MTGELTNHLWQSTLFAFAAGLLTIVFRKNRASVRYWLWLSASLKFFLPFSLLMSLGSYLDRTPAARQFAAQISIPVSFTIEQISEPFPHAPAPASSAQGHVGWLPVALLSVWACGFAGVALIRLRLWIRIRAIVRISTPLEIPARVDVRESPGLLEPGVVGLVRPILLLPEGIVEKLTPSQLEAVLAHELCHVHRRDNLFAAIHMVAEAMFWFHPLVWWIGARLVEERERACDEEVLNMGNQPRIYADAILSVCKLYVESPLVCVSGVTGSDIRRRIEAIMTNGRGLRLNRAKKFLLAVAGVVALAGPVVTGVMIGMGHLPVIHAQSPVTPPIPRAVATAPLPALTQTTAAPAIQSQNRRLVAMLFDLDSMSSDDQARARQAGVDWVQNSVQAADLVTVMAAAGGGISVGQDFTGDPILVKAAILKLSAAGGVSAGRLKNIENASRMLAAFPEKKALIYYSSGVAGNAGDPMAVLKAMDAAARANLAIFPIDVSAPQLTAPPLAAVNPAGGGRGASRPAGVSQEEYDKRVAFAVANYGSPTSAMGRTYIQYGPADRIEGTIWRYNYLDNFHSSAEFEFAPGPGGGKMGMHINYPPPMATYQGEPGAAGELPQLVTALNQERQRQGGSVSAGLIPGLPGRHASYMTYPTPELSTLSLPLDGLTGQIELMGQIKTRPDNGTDAKIVALIRDGVQATGAGYQAHFALPPGAFTCSVIVREQATGRTYGEIISFEVK